MTVTPLGCPSMTASHDCKLGGTLLPTSLPHARAAGLLSYRSAMLNEVQNSGLECQMEPRTLIIEQGYRLGPLDT